MRDGAFTLLRQTWLPAGVVVIVGPRDLASGLVQDLLGFTRLLPPNASFLDPTAARRAPFTDAELETILLTVAVLVALAVGATGSSDGCWRWPGPGRSWARSWARSCCWARGCPA